MPIHSQKEKELKESGGFISSDGSKIPYGVYLSECFCVDIDAAVATAVVVLRDYRRYSKISYGVPHQ